MRKRGGALVGSGIKSENPNASIGGATVGTAVGYGVGKGIEVPVGRLVDRQAWWRSAWIDVGLGISRPNTPSAIPGMAGNVFSSGAQEPTGNSIKDALQRSQEK